MRRMWGAVASSISAVLLSASTPIQTPPPTSHGQQQVYHPEKIEQLQQKIVTELARNRIPLPSIIALDGKEPGFFGWVDRASIATNNFLFGMFEHTTNEGAESSQSVIGVAPDGDIREFLRQKPFGNHYFNYLDVHFEQAQEAIGVHETAHYVDRQLSLSDNIYAKAVLKLDLNKTDPSLIKPADDITPLLKVNIRERVADASAALYMLSNFRDGKITAAIMQWRDSMPEPTHYSASTISATLDAFKNNPRMHMDIVETTKMAASIVTAQIPQIIEEQRAVMAVVAHSKNLEPSEIKPVSANEIKNISRLKKPAVHFLNWRVFLTGLATLISVYPNHMTLSTI